MQCWDCKFYRIYSGEVFCDKYGQLDDEETKRKCEGFISKEEEDD